jgi:cell division protein FtsB
MAVEETSAENPEKNDGVRNIAVTHHAFPTSRLDSHLPTITDPMELTADTYDALDSVVFDRELFVSIAIIACAVLFACAISYAAYKLTAYVARKIFQRNRPADDQGQDIDALRARVDELVREVEQLSTFNEEIVEAAVRRAMVPLKATLYAANVPLPPETRAFSPKPMPLTAATMRKMRVRHVDGL